MLPLLPSCSVRQSIYIHVTHLCLGALHFNQFYKTDVNMNSTLDTVYAYFLDMFTARRNVGQT